MCLALSCTYCHHSGWQYKVQDIVTKLYCGCCVFDVVFAESRYRLSTLRPQDSRHARESV